MFFRLATDGSETHLPLEETYSGPHRTGCWIIGGGPSLAALPIERIAKSPLPKFSINLAGHGLLRPTFWTAYDPTGRFQKSTYLDPSILKFVPRGRAMDVVPGTTNKVCDCPNLVFFDRDQNVGFHDFLGGSARRAASPVKHAAQAITDWQDSLIQAIHIAYSIGFRTLYLAGCEMAVTPGDDWIQAAAEAGIEYSPRELLRDFHQRCQQRGLPCPEQRLADSTRQYHFEETKPLAAAIQTDLHYFRVAQYLRLSRRAMAIAGLDLISVTPESRLNDYFRYQSVNQVLEQISDDIGEPELEITRGLYTEQVQRTPARLGPMRDFKPHHWNRPTPLPRDPVVTVPARPAPQSPREPAEVAVSIREEG